MSLTIIINRGYNASEFRAAGLTATQLINAGYSINNNRTDTASALQQAGYNVVDLVRAGFNSNELRSAGYTLSEIVSAIAFLANG